VIRFSGQVSGVKQLNIETACALLIPDPCTLILLLLRFLVRLVLAATVTELLELETAGGRLLVLGG